MMYLCSTGYSPGREHTILPPIRRIGIEWPDVAGEPILSDRDADAPTLAEAEAAGLLPTWQDARAFADELRQRNT